MIAYTNRVIGSPQKYIFISRPRHFGKSMAAAYPDCVKNLKPTKENKILAVALEKVFSMTNPKALAEYVGFTEPEVKELCARYTMDFNEVARWYDGYKFRREQHIYSPESVVDAMLNS